MTADCVLPQALLAGVIHQEVPPTCWQYSSLCVGLRCAGPSLCWLCMRHHLTLCDPMHQVWLVSDQKEVEITSLWGDDDHAFLVFARSMGCNFCQQLGTALPTPNTPSPPLPRPPHRGFSVSLQFLEATRSLSLVYAAGDKYAFVPSPEVLISMRGQACSCL